MFTKQFASAPGINHQEREPVNFLDSKMLPLQIAGQVLLQELNPLTVMHYTRGTAKHSQTQQFFGGEKVRYLTSRTYWMKAQRKQ